MKRPLLCVALLVTVAALAQPKLSVASNLSGLRNFTPKQEFWAIGQHVQVNFLLSPAAAIYTSIDYYTEGKFKNDFSAIAKSPSTAPQIIPFTATGRLRYQQVGLGLQHYFSGSFTGKDGLNIFGLAGFGYLFSTMRNSASPAVDTNGFVLPVSLGQGRIHRFSFDLGAGAERNLGGPVYAFATLRAWLPASHPSTRYLHYNAKVPLALMAGAGIRVMFGLDY